MLARGGCVLARLVAVSWPVWWLCLGPFGGRMLAHGGCVLARLVAVC